MASSKQSASIKIPADYLEDVRTALVKEIDSDGGALRTAGAVDRDSSAVMLRRDMRLFDELLGASGDVTLTAESDTISNPLVNTLEALVELYAERLCHVAAYRPTPMGDALDLASRLRWAAEEAIRIEPALGHRLAEHDWKRAVA